MQFQTVRSAGVPATHADQWHVKTCTCTCCQRCFGRCRQLCYFFLPLPFFLLGLLGLFGWLGLCDPLLLLAAVPAKPAAPPPPLLLLLLLPASVCGAGDGSMGQPDSSKKMTCMPAVVAARHSEHVLIILVHENIHLMPVIRLANKPAANQEHCTDDQPRCWCCASARPAAAPYAPLQ
jgi:hypothetical protein